MRKTLVLLSLLAALVAHAQHPAMPDVFREMPAEAVPYLSQNNRLDLLDFMVSGMDAEVVNQLGGKSRLLELTDQYLLLQLNDAVTMEMQLLPVSQPVDSAQHILCVVQTYGTDIRESTVAFYSLSWHPLPASDYLDLPLPPGQMFVASLHTPAPSPSPASTPEQPMLTLQPVTQLDAPASEEQETRSEPSTILKWRGKFIKER